jgi:hypothetical protein
MEDAGPTTATERADILLQDALMSLEFALEHELFR